MSSILDALEKLESRRAAGGAPEPPRRTRRGVLPMLAGAAVAAFATGIALTVAWMRPVPAPAPVPEKPAPVAAVTAPAPAATPPAPPVTARAVEKPWGEVVPVPAARGFTSDTIPARDVAERPAAPAPRERRPPLEVAAAPPPSAPPPKAVRPAGAPGVQVSFLVYSSAPERRSVALKIDGGGLVTLREGESASGVTVVEIMPDGVDLAWQDQAYTVPARD